MQKILVLNAKGGCGKTTIATNLASHYASAGLKTALMVILALAAVESCQPVKNGGEPHRGEGPRLKGQPLQLKWLRPQTQTTLPCRQEPTAIGRGLAEIAKQIIII